jgi:hypothetical protein
LSMSAQILPKGCRLGLFASRKTKSNNLTSTPPWMGNSGYRRRWNSSNASPAKRAPHGKAPPRGWSTWGVVGLAAATGIASYGAASKAAESRRLKGKAYSSPAKLGGQPVYANIKEMEGVSNHRLTIVPHCILRYPRQSRKYVKL